MKKEFFTRMLYTVIISVVICMVINTVFFDHQMASDMIIKSAGLGIIIWLISEFSFDAVLKKWPYHIMPSYITLFIIIAVGTSGGSWLLGVTSVWIILLICLCAEVCGFFITIVYRHHYKKRLNTQLEKFKSQNRK